MSIWNTTSDDLNVASPSCEKRIQFSTNIDELLTVICVATNVQFATTPNSNGKNRFDLFINNLIKRKLSNSLLDQWKRGKGKRQDVVCGRPKEIQLTHK